MFTCTRRLTFCAGHRILQHENKCAHLHGHNYVAHFHARSEKLDALGRVIDFSILAERIGSWLEQYWDHGFVYFVADIDLETVLNNLGSKAFKLPYNPTAENMAHYLLHEVCPEVLADSGISIVKVELWETENCYAVVTL